MNEQTSLGTGSIAHLANVTAFVALIKRVEDRHPSLPGMATFHGPSGYGKSTSVAYAANHFGAHHVQVGESWNRSFFCKAVLADMGQKAAGGIPDMIQQIARHLAMTGRALLIDDAQYLFRHRMIDLTRDIHEGSGATVILIGEELLPQKLQAIENVHNRMLDWVAAGAATLDDAEQLTTVYAPGVNVEASLLDRIVRVSRGNTRRICVNISKVSELAHTRGLDTVALSDWGTRAFFEGQAPAPRRLAG